MNKYYSSKESFTNGRPYVTVIFSKYEPASVEANFTSKKNAEVSKNNGKCFGVILTRKQSEREIAEWNERYNFN